MVKIHKDKFFTNFFATNDNFPMKKVDVKEKDFDISLLKITNFNHYNYYYPIKCNIFLKNITYIFHILYKRTTMQCLFVEIFTRGVVL